MLQLRRIGLISGVISLGLLAGCTQPRPAATDFPNAEALENAIAAARLKIAVAKEMGYTAPSDDVDGDWLNSEVEAELGTDPLSPDSDLDRVIDGEELKLGSDPLSPSPDRIKQLEQRVAACGVVANGRDQLLLVPNTVSCTMTAFNPVTCTATCLGTCCFGTVSCTWGWDPVIWGIDTAVGAPCPGWICECP